MQVPGSESSDLSSAANLSSDRLNVLQKQGILAAIIDSSGDAIVSKDLTGTITSWNRSAETLFGYSEAEALGRNVTMLIPEERLDEETSILANIRAGRRVEPFETMRVRKDGEPVFVSLTVSPVKDASGEVVGASKIARDISEQVKTREQISRYTKELEKLNKAKDDFIGMASHELKTPLTTIKANLQLLQRRLEKDGNVNLVDKTIVSVNKLSSLIADMLDVSKIQAGKLQLNFSEFNILKLLIECKEDVQQATNMEVVLEDCPDNILVKADRMKIEQVIFNLLSNAVKYSHGSRQVILKCADAGEEVILSVTDFGIGVPESQQKKIFEKFYRAEGLPITYSGLGIGLYICKDIIERHGGTLDLKSTPGKGSVFSFRLPKHQPEPNNDLF